MSQAKFSYADRRALPLDGRVQMWETPDLWCLRSMTWEGGAPEQGTILFLNGRGDFIEKYAETYQEFLSWGYNLATLDWRGQGLSGRLGNDHYKGHQTDFSIWVSDLTAWFDFIASTMPSPYFLVAHSMGGHIALRFMHNRLRAISRAVLLSPMLGINTFPLPVTAARRLAGWNEVRGQGLKYAPLQRPYGPTFRSKTRQERLTGDRNRFDDEGWWIEQNGALAIGGVTYGWLDAAFRSIDSIFAPGYLETIVTPTLILLPEVEQLVDPAAAVVATQRLPHGKMMTIAGGRHELTRDIDPVRQATFQATREFLVSQDVP